MCDQIIWYLNMLSIFYFVFVLVFFVKVYFKVKKIIAHESRVFYRRNVFKLNRNICLSLLSFLIGTMGIFSSFTYFNMTIKGIVIPTNSNLYFIIVLSPFIFISIGAYLLSINFINSICSVLEFGGHHT